MIRHRAARWLAVATCGLTLIGCRQGTDTMTSPEGTGAMGLAIAAVEGPMLLRAPVGTVPTTTVAAEPVPAEMVAPWQPPSTTTTTTTTEAPPPPPPVPAAPRSRPAPRREVATPTVAAAAAAAAPTLDSAAAGVVTARTNQVRASVGLPALQRDGSLDARAAGWAQEMARSGSLRHSNIVNSVVGNPWSTGGENVGSGPSAEVVHDALVRSSGHYANITGAAYSRIGVGVAVDDSGQAWVVQVFVG